MKNKKIVINTLYFVIMLFVMISCNKDNDKEEELSSMEQISGFECRNYEGSSIGSYGGKVNHYIGNKDILEGEIKYFVVFPIPAENRLNVFGTGFDTTQLLKVWLKQARFEGVLPDNFNQSTLESQPYTGDRRLLQLELMANDFQLDFEEIPNGYYRLYIEIEEDLYYENIIVNHHFWGY